MSESNNIHPVFDRMVDREEREEQAGHRAKVLWLTGLSGSGKTTIAVNLERRLFEQGIRAQVLDGDNIRSGLCQDLGFSIEDRKENTRRIAEVAKLFLDHGVITLCSFISPTKEIRDYVRDIIGKDDLWEIYVNTPLEVCEERDVKGLYKKARAGEIEGFTGIDSPYEAPEDPFFELKTARQTVDESVTELEQHLLSNITIQS